MQQAREQSKPFLSAQAIMLDYMHRALGESVLLQSLVHPAIRTLAQQDAAQHTRLMIPCGLTCFWAEIAVRPPNHSGCTVTRWSAALHIYRH